MTTLMGFGGQIGYTILTFSTVGQIDVCTIAAIGKPASPALGANLIEVGLRHQPPAISMAVLADHSSSPASFQSSSHTVPNTRHLPSDILHSTLETASRFDPPAGGHLGGFLVELRKQALAGAGVKIELPRFSPNHEDCPALRPLLTVALISVFSRPAADAARCRASQASEYETRPSRTRRPA